MAVFYCLPGLARAEEITLQIHYLGPSRPSPFSGQLLLNVANHGFTPVSMIDKFKESVLLVDGRPYPWKENPYQGPIGLPVQGSWEGCLPIEQFVPEGLSPGPHRLELGMKSVVSKPIKIKMAKSIPAAAAPSERAAQAAELKDLLAPGLLKRCAENWLTEPDGGLQSLDAIHYYLEPDVKILVRYKQVNGEQRVMSGIRIYQESRIVD